MQSVRNFSCILLYLFLLLNLSACIENSSGSAVKDIPPVRLECHSAQHADCTPQKAGKRAFVGLTINSVSCGAYLLAQPPTQTLAQVFDVIGTVPVTNEGPFLGGLINAWYNFGGVATYDLPAGNYTACAFIDVDGDERWSSGEPLTSGIVVPGNNEVVLDIWN